MRILVPVKAVPDLVEEIELTEDGTGIDREYLKFVLNEWDDQAIEEALLVKEAGSAEVVVVGLSCDPDLDQALYTAVAKGADRAVKLDVGPAELDTHARAAVLAGYLAEHPVDLVITGVQAADDLDGQLAPTLAGLLGWPHVSVVAAVEEAGPAVRVRQEFSGGRSAEVLVGLPAVIGLQAARQSPRYAPITRIRQVMSAGGLETIAASPPATARLRVLRMYPPESTGHAEMLPGAAGDAAAAIVELLRARGLVKG